VILKTFSLTSPANSLKDVYSSNPSNPSNGNKERSVMLDTVDAALGELLEDQRPTLPDDMTAKRALELEMRDGSS